MNRKETEIMRKVMREIVLMDNKMVFSNEHREVTDFGLTKKELLNFWMKVTQLLSYPDTTPNSLMELYDEADEKYGKQLSFNKDGDLVWEVA